MCLYIYVINGTTLNFSEGYPQAIIVYIYKYRYM